MSTPTHPSSATHQTRAGIRAAQAGAAINLTLAFVKIAAGIVGHTYALIAHGGEALADVAASLIVWGGIPSAAAFVGISTALLGRRFGGGQAWAAADDWAALLAALVIGWNGVSMFLVGLHDLMDRSPGEGVLGPLREVAERIPGVLAVEKLTARRVGNGYRVTIHVQADPRLTLAEGHALGGRVKHELMRSGHRVHAVNVHMEPYE